MPLDAPFKLGPFLVDTQGRVQPGDPERFPTFHMRWRGYAVHARLDEAGECAGGRLVFSTILGRVPSTAGGDPALNFARRARAFDAVRGLEGAVHGSWQVSLLADHRIGIEARRDIDLPASAVDLVTKATCFLLDLAPYLDWIEDVDVTGIAEPAAGGTKKT